jgi:hypothetical protein
LAVKKYFEAGEEIEEVKGRWPDLEIGLVHAFYGRTGGFAVDVTEAPGAIELPPRGLGASPLPKNGRHELSDLVTSKIILGLDPSANL